MSRSKFLYIFGVTTYLSIIILLSSNFFIIWGIVAFLAASFMASTSRLFTLSSTFCIGLVSVLIQILCYRILVQGFYFDNQLTLFGNLGDEARYLEFIKSAGVTKKFELFNISTYSAYLDFLKFLYNLGGLTAIWCLSGALYWLSVSIFLYNLYIVNKNRVYLKVYFYLLFLPDMSIWAASLYKEIWVVIFCLFTFTFFRLRFLQIIGYYGLINLRLVYFIPIFCARVIAGIYKQSLFVTALVVILISSSVYYFFWSDLVEYWTIFFNEARLNILAEKLGLQAIWQLYVVAPLLILLSPIIMIATPPHFYLERLSIFDNLWWITSSTGAYLLYLLPWVGSYRYRDVFLISAIFISITIILSFLFFTNRHRFVVTVLFTFMGAFTYHQIERPSWLGWVFAILVVCCQFLVLWNRGQF